ncbi:TPA: hypothetical protein EYP70_03110 [Candidatus Bathyarchaeota archaeon]|nr:hypothetical protein [Candidatus Bathyarchaeota archaeon]
MKGFDILRKLVEINKPYYTIPDLEKITGLSRKALYVTLNRWVGMKVLERIGKGLYVPFGKEISVELVASQIYFPSYLSFESALARYGILNLVPYTLTFATTRKTRRYTISGTDVEFRQIKREFFWGFTTESGIYLAEKEKAFLDQLYFVYKGMASIDKDEITLTSLSKKKILLYSKKYPKNVQKLLSRYIPATK